MTEEELFVRDNQDVAAVFSTREGRRFFARLLHECGIYTSSLNIAYSENTHETAFREGKRLIGLLALNWLQCADENAIAKVFEADRERKVEQWEKTQ